MERITFLELERKKGQSIIIGDDIIVTVMRVKRGELITFGIDAPDDVRIHREEPRSYRRPTQPSSKD